MKADPMRRPTRYGGPADAEIPRSLSCSTAPTSTGQPSSGVPRSATSCRRNPGPAPYHVLLPADGDGIELLLQQVPDRKATKNRMHLDLRVLDLDVLLDPDGNEFCVLRPPDENRDGLTRPRCGQ